MPGAHIGFWNDHWKNKYPTRDDGIMFGVDGVLGLDYKIKNASVDVSLDWQPSFNFIGYNYFEGGRGGLGIRYAFQNFGVYKSAHIYFILFSNFIALR